MTTLLVIFPCIPYPARYQYLPKKLTKIKQMRLYIRAHATNLKAENAKIVLSSSLGNFSKLKDLQWLKLHHASSFLKYIIQKQQTN